MFWYGDADLRWSSPMEERERVNNKINVAYLKHGLWELFSVTIKFLYKAKEEMMQSILRTKRTIPRILQENSGKDCSPEA